jgi:hypothetical protein
MANHFVLEENSRPKIINCIEDMDDEENDDENGLENNKIDDLKLKISRMSESNNTFNNQKLFKQ